MSKYRRRPDAGFVRTARPKGPNGRGLCRWCNKEVPKGRQTFCGEPCIHEWKIRSDPGYVRRQVYERDKGVCAICGLDTDKLIRIWSKLFTTVCLSRVKKSHQLDRARRLRAELPKRYPWAKLDLYGNRTRSLWQADHIVPVAEGGGECGLENYRTLCVPDHKAETKALRKRLAKASK